MKNFFKGKAATAVIILATVVLAGVAIFTAIRLYQLRQQPVAPNVPSSFPRAQETTPSPTPVSCALSFTLSISTPTPTGTPTSTPTGTPTVTSTATPTVAPTATPTAAPTATPVPPSLPQSGTSWPTIVAVWFGAAVILGSLLLAL